VSGDDVERALVSRIAPRSPSSIELSAPLAAQRERATAERAAQVAALRPVLRALVVLAAVSVVAFALFARRRARSSSSDEVTHGDDVDAALRGRLVERVWAAIALIGALVTLASLDVILGLVA
jgi:hypothetical protein